MRATEAMLTQKERRFEKEWYLFGVAKACALWDCVSNGMWMALWETQPHVVEESDIEGNHPLPDGCICIALTRLHTSTLHPKSMQQVSARIAIMQLPQTMLMKSTKQA
jgi:hypothetical protein